MLMTVGLTGGIACGKSTVDAMFADLGAHIIDADAIVHDLLGPHGRAVAPVISAFGEAVAAPGGGVDRAVLGERVFSDRDARMRLESIVHPLVSEEIRSRIDAISASLPDAGAKSGASGPQERSAEGGAGGPVEALVIVDAALLVETGMDRAFDRLLVVTCSEQAQLERLMASRAMSRESALRRIRAQASSEEKAARADYRISTDGTMDETRRQVESIYASLRCDPPGDGS